MSISTDPLSTPNIVFSGIPDLFSSVNKCNDQTPTKEAIYRKISQKKEPKKIKTDNKPKTYPNKLLSILKSKTLPWAENNEMTVTQLNDISQSNDPMNLFLFKRKNLNTIKHYPKTQTILDT